MCRDAFACVAKRGNSPLTDGGAYRNELAKSALLVLNDRHDSGNR